MKKFSLIQINLLDSLADGLCHNGNDLGKKVGVSRTAVWKQLKQLAELGIPIVTIPQTGYRLSIPLKLLNEQTIRSQLEKKGFQSPTNFHLFSSLDSTNRFLKELPISDRGIDICCAETQTSGRGRFGRYWHSPFGENIYCSSRWHFDCDLSRLAGLSLVVSLAIIATLTDHKVQDDIRIKWPNDILWHEKKLCGCLIEISAESNGGADVIIGIGLNVNSATKEHKLADKPWCSLHEITNQYFDRNDLISDLIIQLNHYIQKFTAHGFSIFLPQWEKIDYLQNQMITVSHPSGPISGVAKGVNELGQLILLDEKGSTHYLASGDTSLKSIM